MSKPQAASAGAARNRAAHTSKTVSVITEKELRLGLEDRKRGHQVTIKKYRKGEVLFLGPGWRVGVINTLHHESVTLLRTEAAGVSGLDGLSHCVLNLHVGLISWPHTTRPRVSTDSTILTQVFHRRLPSKTCALKMIPIHFVSSIQLFSTSVTKFFTAECSNFHPCPPHRAGQSSWAQCTSAELAPAPPGLALP